MATNQPEIKTWMVRANLIRRIPQFFQSSLFLFNRLSVCLVFPHISPAGSLYGRAVDRQATQSLGQRKRTVVDDRETGRTHCPAPFTQPFCPSPVLTPLLHHLFLPHPLLVHYLCSPRARKYFIPTTPPHPLWLPQESNQALRRQLLVSAMYDRSSELGG